MGSAADNLLMFANVKVDFVSIMSKDSVQKEKKEKSDAENLVIPSNEDEKEENSKKLLRSKKKKSVHWNPQLTVKFEFTRYKSEEEPERTDYKCDRKYQYELVGEKLRALYWSGWHIGTIKYYNVDFKEYSVTFEDGSDDYISREDILNGKDVILEPSERSSKISALAGIKREAQGQITDSFRAAKTPKIDKKLQAQKTKDKNDMKLTKKASKKIKNKKDLKSKNKRDPKSKSRNKLSNGISKEDKEENGIVDYEDNRKY